MLAKINKYQLVVLLQRKKKSTNCAQILAKVIAHHGLMSHESWKNETYLEIRRTKKPN